MSATVVEPGAFNRADAATYLACAPETLRQYVLEGRIAPRYHGTKPVYLREDLDALLRSLPDEKAAS